MFSLQMQSDIELRILHIDVCVWIYDCSLKYCFCLRYFGVLSCIIDYSFDILFSFQLSTQRCSFLANAAKRPPLSKGYILCLRTYYLLSLYIVFLYPYLWVKNEFLRVIFNFYVLGDNL